MGFYRNVIVPRLCDLAMRNEKLRPIRQRVIGNAEGRVVEIGAGSGLNLALYGAGTREIIALDPDPKLTAMAKWHAKDASRPITFLDASAEQIPLDTASVDTVVTTWTLCTIPDAHRALKEMRRVLKPSGRLLFVEHGLSPENGVQKWQNRLDPFWSKVSGGCHLNRPISALIEGAGFKIDKLQTGYIPGPRPMTFFYEGGALPG